MCCCQNTYLSGGRADLHPTPPGLPWRLAAPRFPLRRRPGQSSCSAGRRTTSTTPGGIGAPWMKMGVSENSLLIIIPMKNGYFIGNIPYFQTNPNAGGSDVSKQQKMVGFTIPYVGKWCWKWVVIVGYWNKICCPQIYFFLLLVPDRIGI